MRFTHASCVIGLLCFGLAASMDTYYMTNYCGSEVDMILEGINTGRLSLDGKYVGDCNVTIETWYTANRLMFHFEDVSIDKTGFPCDDSYIEVYNGKPPYTNPLHGARRLCGDDTPENDFVPSERYVTFRYVNSNPDVYAKMDLIFTSFHKGYCFSYEYRCSNGRCIDDSVNCNGYNPCGDNSDCELSTAAIVGIAVGAVFGVCVIMTVAYVVCKQRRTQQTLTSSSFEAGPEALLHSVPPPSYGVATQYRQMYGVTTSIQGDPK